MYTSCKLCARECAVNREAGERGYCKMGAKPVIARAALHHWEEPPISGTRGSGAIFFSGCSLGCVYCQNREISGGAVGAEVSDERLAEIMLELEKKGAHNINFVTPTHFVPSLISAVREARERSLKIPIVYNTGSYDSLAAVEALRGTVDIFLPDLKYMRERSALEYSCAKGYTDNALRVIRAMREIAGEPVFDDDGIMLRGVIVRVLLLPGHVAEAKLAVGALYREFSDSVYISIMNQYTPMPGMKAPLDRRVTRSEYRELVGYAEKIGVRCAFVQELGAADESYIPEFDNTGVLPTK